MSNTPSQDQIKRQDFILLMEFLALIHDLGKVSDPEGSELPYKKHVQRIIQEWDLKHLFLRCTEFPNDDPITGEMISLFIEMMKLRWSDFNKEVFLDAVEELGQTVLRHHDKLTRNALQNIISQADSMDAREDRTDSKPYRDKRVQSNWVTNSFGYIKKSETKDARNSRSELRRQFYKKITELFNINNESWKKLNNTKKLNYLVENLKKNREEIFEIARDCMSKSPSMSLYPDNDTSVFEHGYGTAAIAKAMANGFIFNSDSIENYSNLVKKRFKPTEEVHYLVVINGSENKIKKLEKSIENEKSLRNSYCLIEVAKKYVLTYYGVRGYKAYLIFKTSKNVDLRQTNNDIKDYFRIHYDLEVECIKLLSKLNAKLIAYLKKENKKRRYNLLTGGGKSTICLLDCLIGTPNILAIQYTGRDFITGVHRMPDFIGRELKLEQVLKKIKRYIEVDLALGNCVYEDINGLYFLIPELKNITDESLKKETIRKKIITFFNDELEGGILPKVSFELCDISQETLNVGKTIAKLKKTYETNLKRKLPEYNLNDLTILPEWFKAWGQNKEVCQICGKRPVVDKNFRLYSNEKACQWCLNLREEVYKVKTFEKSKFSNDEKNREARFTDQVMDESHKVCLLVGEFGLYDLWLRGDYVMTNVNIRKEENEDENTIYNKSKPNSPSRLRGLVRSVEDYYNELFNHFITLKHLKGYKVRLKKIEICAEENDLESGYYVLPLDKNKLSTEIINNGYTKKEAQLLEKLLTFGGISEWSIYIYVDKNSDGECQGELSICLPKGYYKSENEFDEFDSQKMIKIIENILKTGELRPEKKPGQKKFKIKQVEIELIEMLKIKKVYTIVDEFMILIPANRLYEVISKMNELFLKMFGKAQGKLSLNIGAVFFDHKYPLYLIFDAGKRMLREFREIVILSEEKKCNLSYTSSSKKEKIDSLGFKAEVLKIDSDTEADIKKGSGIELEFKDSIFKDQKYTVVYPRTIPIYNACTRESEDKIDRWYLNAIVEEEGSHDKFRLKSWYSLTDKEVKNDYKVKTGDKVLFVPNIFDFQLVNSTLSRLDIDSSTQNKRKNPNCQRCRTRPMLLETLKEMKARADLFKDVSNSSLYKLQEMLINFLKIYGYAENIEKDFYEKYIDMLISTGSIGSEIKTEKEFSVDKGENYVIEKLKEMIFDGSFFDFMELHYVHNIFDWKKFLRLEEGKKND